MIATIEDALLALISEVLGNTIRESGTLPGGWTHDTLQRALQSAPGVYVGFIGMTPGINADRMHARFTVYAVTKGPKDLLRRRGTEREIGAYEIVERLLARLTDFAMPEVGRAEVRGVDNLFRDAMFDLGGTVYGIQLQFQDICFADLVDPATLDDFITFDARYDVDTHQDGEPDAHDYVTDLDQQGTSNG